MHLCLTLAGEELLDGNRTNGLRLIESRILRRAFGTASGEEITPISEMDHREGCSRDKGVDEIIMWGTEFVV